MSLFLSYTNMDKMNSLHHVKEHPKISNFLQFESHSSKCFKVRAISDLIDLYGNKIQGLTRYNSKVPIQISISVLYSFNVALGLLDELLELKEGVKHESEAGEQWAQAFFWGSCILGLG